MFERFTGQARQAILQARTTAQDLGDRFLGPEHILFGLASAKFGDPVADILREYGITATRVHDELSHATGTGGLGADDAEALQAIGIDLDAVRASVEGVFGPGALDQRSDHGPDVRGLKALLRRRSTDQKSSGHIRVTPGAKKVLEYSLREAVRMRHHEIGSAHILLGLLRTGDNAAIRILARAGVDLAALRHDVLASFSQAA